MVDVLSKIAKCRRADKYEDLEGEDGLSRVCPAAAMPPSVADAGSLFYRRGAAAAKRDVTAPANDVPEGSFTVDHAVDVLGFGWFQIKLSFFTGLVWMADAMEMMILSILGPALHCDWLVPPWQQALMTSVVFGGMMLSSGFWGKFSDKYGRRTELLLCSMFTFFYGLLSALAPNYVWLLVLRGLVGFGIGGVPQSITLYAEFLPSKARAKCVVMIELFWAVGTCFIVLIAVFVMPVLGWRYLLAIAALPLLFFFLACFWLPESPRFDMARGEPERALATLRRIARTNGRDLPDGRLVVDRGEPETRAVKRGQVLDLFVPDLRLTTILLFVIWFSNAFAYYGIVLMTTELFEVGDTCHGGSMEPGVKPAEPACRLECNQLSRDDYVYLLWTSFAEFPGLLITFLIIERLGRRWTIALEFAVFSVFVFLVNLCVSRAVLTTFLFVARAFISGGFQATYVYTPEVYPTTTRAIGLGMCSGVARVGALVTPFFAQVMLGDSVYLAINPYGAIGLIGAAAALLLPIETKNREMTNTLSASQSSQSNRIGSQQQLAAVE